jgi:hypothetical protein
MALHKDWDILRARLVTLLAINIFQPVELKSLKKRLKPHVAPHQLDNILKELIAQNKVAVDKKHYRLTYSGFIKSIIPNRGKFLRDNQRMEHLIQLTKQRGGS